MYNLPLPSSGLQNTQATGSGQKIIALGQGAVREIVGGGKLRPLSNEDATSQLFCHLFCGFVNYGKILFLTFYLLVL